MTDLIRYYLPVVAQLLSMSVVGLVIMAVRAESLSSWLSGSLLAVVCNVWFTFRAVATRKIRTSEVVVALASRGLMEKYAIAASGFAIIFVIIKPYTPVLVFVGFSLMIVVQWVMVSTFSRHNHV